ncbi:MAG: TIGR02221 family CRISPR-associated protein [Firmicutes bacterium]|nr:TIGR02221 family CRISPR-associated protein [Bacillota bacterium]
MGRVLVSFLGRPAQGRYQSTVYELDGQALPGATFALAVLPAIRPDRLVFLGTEGSGWDILPLAGSGLDLPERVAAAVQQEAMTAALLKELEPAVAAALNIPVSLGLIRPGRDVEEQIGILEFIDGALRKAGFLDASHEVILDVTHGFRHLPLLGVLSAWYLQQVRHLQIGAVYYGAFEMRRDGRTPVLNLLGLLNLLQWVNALARFEESANPGVFVPLLQDLPEADALAEGAFRERIHDIPGAVEQLKRFGDANAELSLPHAGSLFTDAFRERLQWAEARSYAHRHRLLAEHFRKSGDYLRATLYLHEAFVSWLTLQDGGDPARREDRENSRTAFEKRYPAPPKDVVDTPDTAMWEYWLLTNLRNTLAHSAESDRPWVRERLTSRERFQETLDALFAWEAEQTGGPGPEQEARA